MGNTTTIAPTTSTSTATIPTESAILAAYRAGWTAYEQALATADPIDPTLAATMVNPVLERVRKNLVAYNVEGIVGKGTTTLHPHVASLTETTAEIEDCTYSTSVLVYRYSGADGARDQAIALHPS